MTKKVLGRDPFTAPSQPAKPVAKVRPPKPAKKAKKAEKKPEPIPVVKPVPKLAEEVHDNKEIDRVELLEGARTEDSAFQSTLYKSTRFVRPSYYGKKLGDACMRYRSEEIDPFGFDPTYWEKVEPFFEFLYRSYWRVEVEGLEHVPSQGRALLVANHSGALPYDGAMIKVAVQNQHPAARKVRFLLEDFVFHFPYLGAFMNRIGGVRACQDNATRLLEDEQLVAVFPEGIKGIGKLFKQRYQLQRFGRGGFIKLALRTGSPIVPVAVVGAEEVHPMLARLNWLARPLGLPYLPVTFTFPLLGPLGAIPLPSKWLIQFGSPFTLEEYPADSAEDSLLVMELSERVRSHIQQMINDLLKKRKGAFF